MQAISRRISSFRASSSSASSFSCCRKGESGVSNIAVSSTRDSTCFSKKSRKSKKEELSMVVKSFVEEYRAANGGKFPPISLLRREIRGGHYTIRAIFQELEYNLRHGISSSLFDASRQLQEPSDEILSAVPHEKDLIRYTEERGTVDQSEVSSAVLSECCNHRDPKKERSKCLDRSEEANNQAENGFDEEIQETCASKTFVVSDYVEELCDRVKQNSSACSDHTRDKDIENSLNRDKEGKILRDAHGPCEDIDPHKEDVLRKVEGEESKAENSSVWGNFSSMARGIFSFLRKA